MPEDDLPPVVETEYPVSPDPEEPQSPSLVDSSPLPTPSPPIPPVANDQIAGEEKPHAPPSSRLEIQSQTSATNIPSPAPPSPSDNVSAEILSRLDRLETWIKTNRLR
jgi:hypothetical protein